MNRRVTDQEVDETIRDEVHHIHSELEVELAMDLRELREAVTVNAVRDVHATPSNDFV